MAEEQTRPTITALVEKLEADGYDRIADAIRNGDLLELADEELALVDAAVYGHGVLIAGKRVNPLELKLIEYGPKGTGDV